jgi:hypothetical protein
MSSANLDLVRSIYAACEEAKELEILGLRHELAIVRPARKATTERG